MRRVVGKKIKGRGEKIKSNSIIYTPALQWGLRDSGATYATAAPKRQRRLRNSGAYAKAAPT